MIRNDETPGDLGSLAVPLVGSLLGTGDPWEPYQLLDCDGAVVGAVAGYLKDLQAAGHPAATQRSYGMDLLRWFRFGWAIECPWDQATRVEARDFCRWVQLTAKPARPHWRTGPDGAAEPSAVGRPASPFPARRTR
jgi:hypothetical protein